MMNADATTIHRTELKAAKRQGKRLTGYTFKPARSRRLRKPFDRLGPKAYASEMIDLGSDYRAIFIWRDGETLSRAAFFGHLLRETERGLLPLAILHYHASHKGLHGLFNCETNRDYVGRHLPGARELAMKDAVGLDPRDDADRRKLVALFCQRFGIKLGEEGGLFHDQA